MKKTLLIVGDSFTADWSSKSKSLGWVNRLEFDYNITNLAQAGVSEYKIYLQLKSVDLSKFDKILVSHTSAYRIPIEEHPIHKGDVLHNNCDLIFSDVSEHLKNPIMKTAYDFYTHIFHPEYFVFTNTLIFQEIKKLVPTGLHITFFDSFYDDSVIKFENVFLENRGYTNHLNEIGNMNMYESICKLLH